MLGVRPISAIQYLGPVKKMGCHQLPSGPCDQAQFRLPVSPLSCSFSSCHGGHSFIAFAVKWQGSCVFLNRKTLELWRQQTSHLRSRKLHGECSVIVYRNMTRCDDDIPSFSFSVGSNKHETRHHQKIYCSVYEVCLDRFRDAPAQCQPSSLQDNGSWWNTTQKRKVTRTIPRSTLYYCSGQKSKLHLLCLCFVWFCNFTFGWFPCAAKLGQREGSPAPWALDSLMTLLENFFRIWSVLSFFKVARSVYLGLMRSSSILCAVRMNEILLSQGSRQIWPGHCLFEHSKTPRAIDLCYTEFFFSFTPAHSRPATVLEVQLLLPNLSGSEFAVWSFQFPVYNFKRFTL